MKNLINAFLLGFLALSSFSVPLSKAEKVRLRKYYNAT
jgi:hypothetical protein